MLKNDFTYYETNKHILSNVVILVDSRENANKHIIDYFVKNEIEYEIRKLEYGDYGIKLKKNVEYGINNDLVLDYAVERKATLEELSGNLTKDRHRLENEFWRGNGKIAVVVENESIDNIFNHKYNTQYNEKSYIASLLTYMHRYNIHYTFVSKSNTAPIIYALLFYKLREEMK